MGLDIYISRKTSSGKECLIHWHQFGPLAEWFREKIYNGTENWKEKMQEQLFPVKSDFAWTGRRELAYLKMMEAIAEDIEDVSQPEDGEELLIQITY